MPAGRPARLVLAAAALAVLSGCGPSYHELRREGQKAMNNGAYGPARVFLLQADEVRPRVPENLHDIAVCCVMTARKYFEQGNEVAARRELDSAIAYYSAAIEVYPGHQASIEGKQVALKLKGQFDEAVRHAEWAAEFVGPSAQQYVLLAHDLESRGDKDGAFMRYRQAVAVEPRNPMGHVEFAKFLLKNGNEPAAVRHLQIAYRLDPLDSWVVDELTQRGAVPPLVPASDENP